MSFSIGESGEDQTVFEFNEDVWKFKSFKV